MAWCPKCKNEYREGISVCTDCGCELIAGEEYDDLTPLTFGEEEILQSLKKYLEYNELKGVTVIQSEDECEYELYVRKDDKNTAATLAKVFLQQEALRRMEEMQGQEEDEEGTENPANIFMGQRTSASMTNTYRKSSEQAEENRSSAWILLIVGIVGLTAMILGLVGVIPFRMGNSYLFYGVMTFMFLLFIVSGFASMKNAKVFDKKAESENTLRDEILKWCKENLSAEAVDAELGEDEQLPEEMLYFKRAQYIKDKLNHQFMNLEPEFLDSFIDEEIYDSIFDLG